MKFLVLGSGMMGSALALDLARSKNVEKVTLADADLLRAEQAAHRIGLPTVHPVSLDVTMIDNVIDLMKRHDCALGAVSFRYNYVLTKAALEAGIHFCDLGGNDEVVRNQMSLDAEARKAGVLIVPNCGLAPGLANVLAARGVELFDSVDSVKIRVGGLPQHPRPPFNYQLVFSVEGLINEYSGMSTVIRDGKVTQVETLTEIETVQFSEPPGTLEAFHTSGGSSLLPMMFEGKVRELDYKTLRYPGHCEKFKALLDLGFASNEPITIGSNLLTAKEFFLELLKRKLDSGGRDIVVLRVSLVGRRGGHSQTLTFELIDFYDEINNITSMMRTTSFPTSIIAQMVVGGTLASRGVLPPESCVPLDPLIAELAARRIYIKQMWSELVG
jgi:lysine 6-dehydrogenase